jgi:hypothetical protein
MRSEIRRACRLRRQRSGAAPLGRRNNSGLMERIDAILPCAARHRNDFVGGDC